MAHLLLLISVWIYFMPSAFAHYPSAKPNANLLQEIKEDSDRIIPSSEHFSFAFDGHVSFRGLGHHDFFHGVNYWNQLRSEARPHSYFTLNVRTIFYAGSNSYGYVRSTSFYNLLSLSAIWPEPVAGGIFSARILDLGRQTIGQGLLVQEKEFNGGIFQWRREENSISLRGDGTGLFTSEDDTWNLDLQLAGGQIGGGFIYWKPQGDFIKPVYYYLSSVQSLGIVSLGMEVGVKNGQLAELFSLRGRPSWDSLNLEARIEARNYENGFAEDLVGGIEHQYISYDQLDKRYTNAANIFTVDDDVAVLVTQLDLNWELSHFLRFHWNNEMGKFFFRSTQGEPFYFYRLGGDYCPFEKRDDCLGLFVSNKVLSDSFRAPPYGASFGNFALFRRIQYVGVEGNFRF